MTVRILWIGAHPDDELFVAPWLARLRTTAGAKLGFLVATRGEQGDCGVSQPRHRDVGSVREAEMRDAMAGAALSIKSFIRDRVRRPQ